LLQLLDDGRLTDGQGRKVSFKNAVVIMTSNVGSHLIQESIGKSHAAMCATVTELLRKQFRPEFLNRIDEIVIFNQLSAADLAKIVELQVAKAQSRLADRQVQLALTARAKAFLAKEGYDPTYGARPLRRTIPRHLMDQLAKRLLAGEITTGQTVTVDTNGADGLVFKTT